MDTLTGYVGIGIVPSGTSDPYALRRAAAGLVALLATSDTLPSPESLFHAAWNAYAAQGLAQTALRDTAYAGFVLLLTQRLDAALEEKGVRYDLRDAVLATPIGSVFETQARALALQELRDSQDAKDALAAATRIGNILRFAEKEGFVLPPDDPSPALMEHPAEQALLDALEAAAPALVGSLTRREYPSALQALAGLRPPVDAFFRGYHGDGGRRRAA